MRNLFTDRILVEDKEALRCKADECREIFVHCVRRGEWTTIMTQRACTVLYRGQRGVAIPSVILFPAPIENNLKFFRKAKFEFKETERYMVYGQKSTQPLIASDDYRRAI